MRRALSPGGALYLFNQAPGWKGSAEARMFGDWLAEKLSEGGFTDHEVVVGALRPAAVCVIARDQTNA